MKPLNTFLLIAPAALLMLGVFLVPFLLLAVLSLWTLKPGTLSLDTSLTLANYARLFGDTYYLGSLWTTLWMSAVTTLACLILGLPLAQWIVRRAGRARGLLIGLVIIPMVCGALLPTLGLVNLLGPLGVVNGALKSFGLITSSLPLLGRPIGVIVGLVQAFLPLMVLPLISVMKGISPTYVRASSSHGAGPLTTFLKVYLPLTLPGIGAGCVLTFIVAAGYYVTPTLVGGPSDQMLSYFVAFYANTTINWGMSAALGIVLLVCVLALYIIVGRIIGIGRIVGME